MPKRGLTIAEAFERSSIRVEGNLSSLGQLTEKLNTWSESAFKDVRTKWEGPVDGFTAEVPSQIVALKRIVLDAIDQTSLAGSYVEKLHSFSKLDGPSNYTRALANFVKELLTKLYYRVLQRIILAFEDRDIETLRHAYQGKSAKRRQIFHVSGLLTPDHMVGLRDDGSLEMRTLPDSGRMKAKPVGELAQATCQLLYAQYEVLNDLNEALFKVFVELADICEFCLMKLQMVDDEKSWFDIAKLVEQETLSDGDKSVVTVIYDPQ